MNGVQILSTDDFVMQESMRGNILSNRIKGLSMVLFFSTNCQHCQKLLPVFKQLPSLINGCYFGMMNINNNRRFVELSANTISPITHVPLMIVYYDGKPYKKYPVDFPHDSRSIQGFIWSVHENIKRIHSEQKRVSNKPVTVEQHINSIPDFTIGHPVKGNGKDMVTYLKDIQAYIK
jgi:hypothetical protein